MSCKCMSVVVTRTSQESNMFDEIRDGTQPNIIMTNYFLLLLNTLRKDVTHLKLQLWV